MNGPHGTAVTQSLFNDETILSSQGNVIEHTSLIVDSANRQILNADVSILSQDRYGSKKSRGVNAMSELRKS